MNIEFITTDRKLTTFEMLVASYVRTYINVEGDWLNEPATMHSAEGTMKQCIEELQKNPKHERYKYANKLVIVKDVPGQLHLCSYSNAEDRNKFIIGVKALK
ncbi:MAG: hypothetical protein EOO10_21915 [Chitinophagaceae bacterium]|nr:MAG: hypothetical protein EOO10_21915 [Chitinophagaceae bacterium]